MPFMQRSAGADNFFKISLGCPAGRLEIRVATADVGANGQDA